MEELGPTICSLKNYRTYFLKSAFLDRLPTCSSTSFSFTTIVFPFKSGASKLMFSSTFSKIVCSLLAPIFSTLKLTSSANEHIFSIPSSLKTKLTPSVSIKAIYCLVLGFVFAASTIWNYNLMYLQSFSWIIGAFITSLTYYLLAKK